MNIFKDRLKTGNLNVCHFIENFDIFRIISDDIHKQPQESRGVDFSRVRLWNLDGLGKFYRWLFTV